MSIAQPIADLANRLSSDVAQASTSLAIPPEAVWDMMVHKVVVYGWTDIVLGLLLLLVCLAIGWPMAKKWMFDQTLTGDEEGDAILAIFLIAIAFISILMIIRGFFLIANVQTEAIYQLQTLLQSLP